MDSNLFKKPFKLDITKEFDELKQAFNCNTCQKLLTQPIVLNTCNHIQCDSCLDKKKLVCSICKYPYNEADISSDMFTACVLQSIQNIQNIFIDTTSKKNLTPKQSTSVNDDNQEIIIADTLSVEHPREALSRNTVSTKTLTDINYEIVVAQKTMKRNPKGETPLHLACKKGDLKKVEELTKSGVDVNTTDWANWAPIHEAVQGKHYNCIEFLLKNGALINVLGTDYITPLHKAITCNADNITNLLLTYGAKKDIMDYTGFTPLNYVMNTEKQNILRDIEPTAEYIPKVFFNKEVIVYTNSFDNKTISMLTKNAIKFVSLQDYIKKDVVTHLIVSDDKLNLNILLGILKGIFIVDEKWASEFPIHVFPFKHILDTYRTVTGKSIHNKLERKPKLFDGIKFYIVDHDKPIKIHTMDLTKKDLAILIEAGGGRVMARAPAVRTAEEDQFSPYHARDSTNLKECCNYIIFSDTKEQPLTYNMKELQHRSSTWLIDCILNFKIE